MKYKIGFNENDFEKRTYTPETKGQTNFSPVRSVVQVFFSCRGQSWAYYNDSFDLHEGDIVYVEGKLEGKRGIVINVNYNFKIKIADYKKVIAVADTDVKGELYFGNDHMIAFDSATIPFDKTVTWFIAPNRPDDEIVSGSDDTSFPLDELSKMDVSPEISHRGYEYYCENRVAYISLDNGKGHAIVEGNECYEIEFTYRNGEISNLICGCYCNYHCKHEVAALLQLRELLETIEKGYSKKYEETNYFAAVGKGVFSTLVLGKCKNGKISL